MNDEKKRKRYIFSTNQQAAIAMSIFLGRINKGKKEKGIFLQRMIRGMGIFPG